jgi:hypothetical protein
VDRIVHHLPGDRASRRTRARTLLRLALALALVAGIVLWQFQATKDYASAVFASTAVVAVVIGLSYSRLRSDDGTSVEFPNALLAQKAIVSSTLRGGGEVVRVRASVASADWERASSALRERAGESGLGEVDLVVCDIGPDTMTIEVRGRCAGTAQVARAEQDLRAAAAALVGAEHA